MISIPNIQNTGRSLELRKLVIKLGSAVVTTQGSDEVALDLPTLESLADSVKRLREAGVEVILVSSGSIAMGRRQFPGFVPRTIPDRQALAAIGQVGLMHAYKELFNARGFLAAQVLLTRGDMESRQRYLNTRYTLERLLDLGAVPVINENDTVTVDELKFGDNDELSSVVASKMGADLLVILSVIKGLYAEDPTQKQTAAGGPIDFVEKIDEKIMGLAGAKLSKVGTGGMSAKLQAMQTVTHAGLHGVIAGGKTPGILEQIVSGTFTGTWFAAASEKKLPGRIRWIANGRRPKGQISIDAGARDALVIRKKSLLAAGITRVEGNFERGELVDILGPERQTLARGLSNYSSAELDRIKGKKTAQIEQILGATDYPEAVHRDNLVMQR